MRVAILTFSPSGSTARVGGELRQRLEQRGATVRQLDVAGDAGVLIEPNVAEYLWENVGGHDVLVVGGPVYTHHLQYHVQELIEALPDPCDGWGRYALPFVTYGGICSGIALEEAGELLSRSGREVLAGVKVAAVHAMTRAFMPTPVNSDRPTRDDLAVLDAAADAIVAAGHGASRARDIRSLSYQPEAVVQASRTVFIEKEWHAGRYPAVVLDAAACRECGICVSKCPVNRWIAGPSGAIAEDSRADCIHCFECVTGCEEKAISLVGDPEKARAFVAGMLRNGMETPASAVYAC